MVYKRYRGKRLKPGDKDYAKGKWVVAFSLSSGELMAVMWLFLPAVYLSPRVRTRSHALSR